jgi:hypothetical protein
MGNGRSSQDPVPSLNRTHVRTHPDRLAATAALLGMRPAPVEGCRVLELGCANGRNLLPMALNLPGSDFVGVDLSARQIADGQAALAELVLANKTPAIEKGGRGDGGRGPDAGVRAGPRGGVLVSAGAFGVDRGGAGLGGLKAMKGEEIGECEKRRGRT